jgi:hypothetical protein
MSDQPTPAPKKTTARYAEQDQAIANFINETREIIEIARDDPAIAPVLAGRGYDAEALAAGLALQQAALDAYAARQRAMTAQKQSADNITQAFAAARSTYLDFRKTARLTFAKNTHADTDLVLTAKIPTDMDKFIVAAHTAYTQAQSEAYQAALATYGFPAETLAAALTALDALSTASKAQETVSKDAVQATLNRDAAVKALEQWVKHFKGIASIALRPQPTQAKKLKL